MYYRAAVVLLAVAFAASSCASSKLEDEEPEQGPDSIVAGPPDETETVDTPPQSGLGEVQVSGADRGELVELRFGYPAPVSATVTERAIGSGRTGGKFAYQTRMRIKSSDDGLRIRTYRLEAVPVDDSKESREYAEQLNQYSADLFRKLDYSLVVDKKGGIFRTENLDTVRLIQQQRLVPNRRVDRQLKRFVRAFIDAANVDQEPEMDWVYTVQFWDGQDLKIGERKEAHFVSLYPTASRGFQRATVNVEYMVAGRVPCTGTDAKRQCVRLRMSAVPKSDELTLAVRRFHAKVKGSMAQELRALLPSAKSLTSRMDLEIIVDPDTLLPYRVERVVQDRLVLENGQVETPESHLETVYNYE